jgi:hypothetical protein
MAVWKETGSAASPATLIFSSRDWPARVVSRNASSCSAASRSALALIP